MNLSLAALSTLGMAILAAVCLTGCSATGALNTLEPKGRVTIERDIAYGTGARRSLDLYRPTSSAVPSPVVVFFYGGGWDKGDRANYAFVGAAFARHGYLTLIPDYRLFPDVRWPDFLRDGAQAVRWAKDNAARYGGDPDRIVLVGHSAGAYNALELAVDRRWLGEAGLDPSHDIAAVAGLSGPYDFLPLRSETLKAVFGPEDMRPDTQPINHVTAAAPPLMLATGGRDTVVDPRNSQRLAAKAAAAGVDAELKVYPRLGHVMTVGALASPLRAVAPVFADVTRFIDAHTRGASNAAEFSQPQPKSKSGLGAY